MLVQIKYTINKFNLDLKKLFSNRLLDIVIYGSTVRGGFCEQSSDIDFIVFVDDIISKKDKKFIISLHEKYRQSTGSEHLLEGKYIGIKDLKMSNGYYIGTSRSGWKEINKFNSDYIEQAMILDCYCSNYDSGFLQNVIISDFDKVNSEILKQIDSFIAMDILGKNTGFAEYACVAAAKSLYTFINKGFLSKQDAQIWLEKDFFPIDYENAFGYMKKIKSLIS